VIDIADLDPVLEIVDDDLTDIPKDHGTVKPIPPHQKIQKTTIFHSATYILKLRQRGRQRQIVVRSGTRTELSVWLGWQKLKQVFGKPRETPVGNGMVKVDLQQTSCRPSYRPCS